MTILACKLTAVDYLYLSVAVGSELCAGEHSVNICLWSIIQAQKPECAAALPPAPHTIVLTDGSRVLLSDLLTSKERFLQHTAYMQQLQGGSHAHNLYNAQQMQLLLSLLSSAYWTAADHLDHKYRVLSESVPGQPIGDIRFRNPDAMQLFHEMTVIAKLLNLPPWPQSLWTQNECQQPSETASARPAAAPSMFAAAGLRIAAELAAVRMPATPAI